MNMLSRMDRHICIYLLIISCFTLVCINGRHQDVSSSCEVSVKVRRNTILRSAPNQSLTIKCPVSHCGESLNVTWCKLDTDQCERLNYSENVKIRQDKQGDKLISCLTFERISIHDDGLYRCGLNGYKNELISHLISVSVSDSHQNLQNVADALSSPAADVDASWQPYFFIVFGVGLLVAAMTVLTLLRIHGWRRILTVNQTKAQEKPSHNIPNLPKARAPSLPVPPSNLYSLDENCSRTAVRPTPQPRLMTSITQFTVVNPEDPSQGSHRAVYAVISRQAVREQHTQITGNEENAYAAIRMS
ncbi:B- and T-lymphocyte attenuator [Cheilinus undulatus]|uniref:B- and T-lymphocyte attenuator n=1 Tax=Cheilinus undulatus TaxID=241271 RepID=UPI001BD3C76C|nr:B- and T-lymphocyte attenuator [Cheilinus undulatus]